MDPCPTCGGPHPFHAVVRARSAKRWRGTNFDAAAAEGAVGAALMRALGLDPGNASDFAEFARVAVVKGVRPRVELNPEERFDPAEGEAWEFHAAVRREVTDADAVRKALEAAVAGARNFTLA